MKSDKQKEWSNLKKPELISELSQYQTKIYQLMSDIKNANDKELILNSEIRNLESEIKYLKEKVTNTEILFDRFNELEEKCRELEEKLGIKEQKIEDLQKDKEILLREKAVILDSKTEIFQQLKEKDLEIQMKNQKIEGLREKFKQSSSDLLSKSMQIDKLIKKDKELINLEERAKYLETELDRVKSSENEKTKNYEKIINDLNNKLEEKDKREEYNLNKLEQKIKSLESEIESSKRVSDVVSEIKESKEAIYSIEHTKVINNFNELIKIAKNILLQGKSNIRLLLPDIEDLKRFELTDLIKEIPSKVRINICANIKDPAKNLLIGDIKNYCQITNYLEQKLIALNVDSSKILIGFYTKDHNILAIYTEYLEIINLFKAAIMEPFIKGTKII